MSAANLVELCERLRENTVGMTTDKSLEYLHSLVGKDIKIKYEVTKKGETNDSGKNAKQSRYAHLSGSTVSRVQLTADRLKSNFSNELVRTCNGVVLDCSTWNVLSMPTAMFNPKFRFTDVAENISNYTVYEIKDGTTVTLYWFEKESKWCISTTNGFDVSNYKWMGNSTYMDTLLEVTKLYPDFSFDKLSKETSYTIGFRHNNFHPLLTDTAKMWLIQSCNLKSMTVETNTNIGIPLQTTATLPKLEKKSLLKWMLTRNENSLTRYINSVRDGSKTPEIHYGYVLRNTSFGANSNIILESELLKQIRSHMYNLPKIGRTEVVVSAEGRMEYAVLRAYLSLQKYVFLNLFPQFSDNYRKYDALFNKLSNRVVAALRNRNTREIVFNSLKHSSSDRNLDKVAVTIIRDIEDCGRINVMDSQGPGIVLDFITNKNYLDLYYSCLVTK
ncbi:Hypothetical protein PACV_167 [Pacmanvirus A23]|uniref:Hypothetical protein n=1 Tax=Pacmanvirus A23 TaxID=1932881 RepID=UPI000A093324|nr:Hypothetical protein B9W72_gp165 [Pacmanvirus A23]SIP85882.1 Hypothetical protein PACV_167 [Pacmanvirus A23]